MWRKLTAVVVFSVLAVTPSLTFAQEGHEHHHMEGMEQGGMGMEEESEDVGTCPVLGGKASKDISYTHEGKTYYFCCPMCIDEFKKDPERYISKMEE